MWSRSSTEPTRPRLLLRVDVSHQHGTGHLMRCQALGEAWERAGGQVAFASTTDLAPYAAWLGSWPMHALAQIAGGREDAEATAALAREHRVDWIVADGYHFDAAWQEAAEGRARVLLFDDYGHGAPHAVDLVLNQNPGAAESLYAHRAGHTRLLLGPQYAVLRGQFAAHRSWQRTPSAHARRLLVTFGGTDPAEMTLAAVQELRGLPVECEVVVGGGNPRGAEIEALCAGTNLHVRRNVLDMPGLMAECDFAFMAAGTTTLEASFLQLPQLLVTVAENQVLLAAALESSGAAKNLGWNTSLAPGQVRAAVEELAADTARRATMSAAAGRLVDGWGAERVVAQMRASALHLRRAHADDARQLWEWANESGTRAASFHSASIPWEEHLAWFKRQLENPAAPIYLAEERTQPGLAIGSVRFAQEGTESTISVVLAPESRGRGLAAPLLCRASAQYLQEFPGQRIHAWIKPENSASQAAFRRAGYLPAAPAVLQGHHALHFTLEAAQLPV